MDNICALARSIGVPDEEAAAAAATRQNNLTKPAGSLGLLESLAIKIAGITGCVSPRLDDHRVILMAADHGVAAEAVSAYPAEVTGQMLTNFLHGGAAINVLARLAGASVVVVDMGVRVAPPGHPRLVSRRQGCGTDNFANGPAMSRHRAQSAVEAGIEVALKEIDFGARIIATGEMGIGNTTAASALTAVLLPRPAVEVTGRGTGIDQATLVRKVALIERAIEANDPDPADPLGVLAALGGFEIAGLTGVILAAASRRVPIVLDGFISGVAALLACRLCPRAASFLIAAHRSSEPAHAYVLDALKLRPLLDLDLRLGEGSGAALALPLIDAALAIHNEMATFERAGVSHEART